MNPPRHISVRPATGLAGEGGDGIVVWVQGRRATVQLWYPEDTAVSFAISATVSAWYRARACLE